MSVSLCVLKLTRETTIQRTQEILVVAEQRLSTPVVFTAAFLKTPSLSLVILKGLCERLCALD
jgi:hypothetical protein